MKTVKILGILAILAILAIFSTKAFCQDYQTVDGLKYKIYNPHNGPKPQMGDKAMCDLIVYDDHDSLFFNSIERKQIIPIPIQKSQFQGDLMQGIKLLSVGDSAVFLISTDSIAKLAGKNNTLRLGAKMKYVVVLRSIFNDATDEGIITDYIKANKIEGMQRTADGLYYKITQKGTGDIPKKGDSVTAHYTGMFLNGKTFDSDANRPGPGFSFILGYHQVISGWDEAFALMPKGSKATLLIPSKLGYGAMGSPPTIAANTVLKFDVELVDFKPFK